jgi:hypothetical protein
MFLNLEDIQNPSKEHRTAAMNYGLQSIEHTTRSPNLNNHNLTSWLVFGISLYSYCINNIATEVSRLYIFICSCLNNSANCYENVYYSSTITNFILVTGHAHYIYRTCPLHIQNKPTTYTEHAHYIYRTCSLHIQNMLITYTEHAHYIYRTCSLHIQNKQRHF